MGFETLLTYQDGLFERLWKDFEESILMVEAGFTLKHILNIEAVFKYVGA